MCSWGVFWTRGSRYVLLGRPEGGAGPGWRVKRGLAMEVSDHPTAVSTFTINALHHPGIPGVAMGLHGLHFDSPGFPSGLDLDLDLGVDPGLETDFHQAWIWSWLDDLDPGLVLPRSTQAARVGHVRPYVWCGGHHAERIMSWQCTRQCIGQSMANNQYCRPF